MDEEGQEIELKPKGKDIKVAKDNKEDYVQLMLDYYLYQSVSLQIEEFKKGFY